MKLIISDEVRDFMRTLAPVPKKIISRALDSIQSDTSNIEPLQDPPLEKYYKVKAGNFRIICAIEKNTAIALVVERRAIVYEIFSASMLEEIFRRN